MITAYKKKNKYHFRLVCTLQVFDFETQNVAINFPTSPAFYPAVVVRFFGQVTLWSIKEK